MTKYQYYRDFVFPVENLIDYQPALNCLREKYKVKTIVKGEIMTFRCYSDEEIPAKLLLYD